MENSRRQFLKTSAVISVAPFVPASGTASPSAGPSLHTVVVEAASTAALQFGARLGQYGLAVHEIRADVTAVWYEYLDQQWRARPLAIAGMTLRPALFCLEQLALVHGMRVVHHGIHRSAGSIRPTALADWLMRCGTEQRPCGSGLACGMADTPDDHRAMHSWVIAPVGRGV